MFNVKEDIISRENEKLDMTRHMPFMTHNTMLKIYLKDIRSANLQSKITTRTFYALHIFAFNFRLCHVKGKKLIEYIEASRKEYYGSPFDFA